VIILGTGGNCVDILDSLNDINDASGTARYRCAGFLDDNPASWGRDIHGARVLGPLDAAHQYAAALFVNGIGSPTSFVHKQEIIDRTGLPLDRFTTIVHPTASVSRLARLAPGVVVFQNVTITSNVQIGEHVIVLPNSVISHDDVIGAYTCIAGGACISGGVTIGHCCYLGSNCSIIDGARIGAYALIGMGSTVLRDVPENSVMIGSPARFLRHTRPM
jgi:sugar O-acyltransferase (sialic acid O-acetyltransferase NeuD family)